MEIRTSLDHRQAVFGNLLIDDIMSRILGCQYCVLGTDTDTASAADTLIMIDGCLSICEFRCTVSTDLLALMTADTTALIHIRLSGAVHIHLSGTRSAAHAEILQGAAKAGHLMPLEMSQGNDHIGIHDSPSDLCSLHILPVYRNIHIIGSL